jgi:hypothetical protein
MALDIQFPNFNQAIVSFGQWITSKAARLAFQGLPYLYEAIGNVAAPQVGGAKKIAGHDHGSLYGGASISRTGVCFSSGGRSPLWTTSLLTDGWVAVDNVENIYFRWGVTPYTTLGSHRVAYVSPGIDTYTKINRSDEPCKLEVRMRVYVYSGGENTERQGVQIRLTNLDSVYARQTGTITNDKRQQAEVLSPILYPGTAQREIAMVLPVRADWWNAIEIHARKTENDGNAMLLYVYDLAISETYRVSQPVSPGQAVYK